MTLQRSDQASSYLSSLFAGRSQKTFICTWTKGGNDTFFTDPQVCADYCVGKTDVYVSMSVYSKQKRLKNDSQGIPGLWLDIDRQTEHKPDGATSEQISKLMSALPSPTMVIDSGGGLQPYWLFDEFMNINRSEEREFAQDLEHAWWSYCNALAEFPLDPVHDLSRVLRVPGTYNGKYGEPIPVSIVAAEGDLYDYSELRRLCLDHWGESEQISAEVGDYTISPTAHPPKDKFDALCANHDTFEQTWECRRKDKPAEWNRDMSSVQAALSSTMAHAGWTVQERANTLIAHREKHRPGDPKNVRRSYLDMTLARGMHGVEQKLPPAVEIVEVASPPTEVKLMLPLETAAELHERASKQDTVPWIWQGYIERGTVSVLGGKPKAGKSTLLIDMCSALISTGAEDFLGREVITIGENSHIIVVSEEGVSTLVEKMPHTERILCMTREHAAIQFGELVAGLHHAVQVKNVPLVVIDTMSFWMSVPDSKENDPSYMNNQLKPLLDLASKTNVAVLLVHHARKDRSDTTNESIDILRGAGAIAANVDFIFVVSESEGGKRKLTARGRHKDTPQELIYDYDLVTSSYSLMEVEGTAAEGYDAGVLGVLLKESELSVNGIANELGGKGHRSKVQRSLQRLERSGFVTFSRGKVNGQPTNLYSATEHARQSEQ